MLHTKMVRGILLLIGMSCLQTIAWPQQRGLSGVLNDAQKVIDKEVAIARENFATTTKNYCVNFWSASDKLEALSKFATISEQCRCTEEEMSYLATDDLSIRLIQMQIQTADASVNYLSEDAIKATVDEWQSKYQAANKTCTGRFIRRRQSSR
jgi:hypothetical protein